MQNATYSVNKRQVTVSLRDDADESVAAEIFSWREYRVAEDFIAQTNLPIFDVGAHAGFFSLYARALNGTVPIIALEPEPNNIAALRQHLQANNIKGVRLIEGALSSKFEKRKLEISTDSHNHKLTEKSQNSLTVQGYDLASLQTNFPNGIGLVKMDIEGGEYEIFENLSDQEFSQIKAIIMEYHDVPGHKHQEIEKILREHGFGVQTFPSKFDKTMGFFWAKNKRY